jgi:hypothetical protein
MKPKSIRIGLIVTGAACALPGLSAQNSPRPSPAASSPLKSGDVREEQRHIADYLTYGGSDLQKGIERAGVNNLDLATVSGLHAVDQLLQCSKLMDQDPQHVERVRPWLFDNDIARSEMRANFFQSLKPRYDDLEERLDAFAHSLKDRGYSAVLVTINKLRAWNNSSDAAAKRQIEQEIDQVVTEVSRAAAAKAGGGSDASTGLHAGGPGSGGMDLTGSGMGGGGYGNGLLSRGGGGGAGGGDVSLGNGATAVAAPGGVIVSDPSGRSATLAGATLNPDGTARLADGRTVDLRNAAIDPQGNLRLASGEVLPGSGGSNVGAAALPDANSHFVGSDGSEVVIPADFDWKNGVATGIEKVFVGGRGGRLIRETKVTFRPTPSPGQMNTYVVTRENGESRTWAFDVATVPGSEKKSSGAVTIAFELSDRNGSSGFNIANWEINGPSGSPAVGNGPGNQTTATFTSSGEYTVVVSGKTDWGSVFAIKKTLPVGVE